MQPQCDSKSCSNNKHALQLMMSLISGIINSTKIARVVSIKTPLACRFLLSSGMTPVKEAVDEFPVGSRVQIKGSGGSGQVGKLCLQLINLVIAQDCELVSRF